AIATSTSAALQTATAAGTATSQVNATSTAQAALSNTPTFTPTISPTNTGVSTVGCFATNSGAKVVVGQTIFTTSNSGISANSYQFPFKSFSDGTRLFVVDSGSSRVLIYNTIPVTNGSPADVVVGQPDFTSFTSNQGLSSPTSRTLGISAGNGGVFSDGTRLFIADSGNNRVLIYNSIPVTNNAPADVVVGQSDFNSGNANAGSSPTKANGFGVPSDVWSDGTRLFVSDYGNSRVLIFNSIPIANNASADLVVGQPDLVSGSYNQNLGASPTANTLASPQGGAVNNGKLFIADTSNHRILIYNSIPVANDAPANVEIGQVDFSGSSLNQGGLTPSANTLYFPDDVSVSGGLLVIADSQNNRSLIFTSIPVANNASANEVIGQPNFTSNSLNQGLSGPQSNTLASPAGGFLSNGSLFITDSSNNRVLIFNCSPTPSPTPIVTVTPTCNPCVLTTDQNATLVVGQPNFTTSNNSPVNASSLHDPYGLFQVGSKLIVSDDFNHRVLIYNPLPTGNQPAAVTVIGQTSFTGSSLNQGLTAPTANTLAVPGQVWSGG
ncbi:MAG TPA: hypothetical protein VIJ93_08190, partial [bacterium]